MSSVLSFLGYRTSDERKYDYLEPLFHEINRDFVALNQEEQRRNNVVLHEVLNQIVHKMKDDKLFKGLFRKVYFGGSYYDDLKVSKPNEYDLDLLLDLPTYTRPVISATDIDMPGYVEIELENMGLFKKKKDEAWRYPLLAEKLLNEHTYHLSTFKVLSWMESVLQKALNKFPTLSSRYEDIKQIQTSQGTFYFCSEKGDYNFSFRKQGPAFTLKIRGKFEGEIIEMDIDLVPCFVFAIDKLPEYYKTNENHSKKHEFFVVPKKVADQRYWRLSFQDQEGELIKGKPRLKPVLRLLKQLRDCSGHYSIASYYIKTIFLWEILERNDNFWTRQSLSYVFMAMLQIYKQRIENYEIPYFWNEYNNLLDQYQDITLSNIANHLRGIINDFESHNPERIRKHFDKLQVTPDKIIPCKPKGRSIWNSIEDLPENRPSNCTIL